MNHHSLSDVVGSDRETDQRVPNALAIIAERVYERERREGNQIRDRRSWTATVLKNKTEELKDELTKRAAGNSTWTAEDLASQFEPPFDPYSAEVGYR